MATRRRSINGISEAKWESFLKGVREGKIKPKKDYTHLLSPERKAEIEREVRGNRRNPLPSLFRNYWVMCDGKEFGPYKTRIKADTMAMNVARVLDKPAKVFGQPKSYK